MKQEKEPTYVIHGDDLMVHVNVAASKVTLRPQKGAGVPDIRFDLHYLQLKALLEQLQKRDEEKWVSMETLLDPSWIVEEEI